MPAGFAVAALALVAFFSWAATQPTVSQDLDRNVGSASGPPLTDRIMSLVGRAKQVGKDPEDIAPQLRLYERFDRLYDADRNLSAEAAKGGEPRPDALFYGLTEGGMAAVVQVPDSPMYGQDGEEIDTVIDTEEKLDQAPSAVQEIPVKRLLAMANPRVDRLRKRMRGAEARDRVMLSPAEQRRRDKKRRDLEEAQRRGGASGRVAEQEMRSSRMLTA
jgi:hypothetical protein